MTSQAKNSINLYSGQDANKIKQLLRIQNESVINELKQHFDATDIDDLAIKLSMN